MPDNETRLLVVQYDLLKQSRAVLLEYCLTLHSEHFRQPIDAFAGASMQSLLVHVGNTYIHWVARFGMQREVAFYNHREFDTVSKISGMFDSVNKEMGDFMNRFGHDWNADIEGVLGSKKPVRTSALAIATHVMTHEFHHKGQILSMSRQLGYTPVDTDIIRT